MTVGVTRKARSGRQEQGIRRELNCYKKERYLISQTTGSHCGCRVVLHTLLLIIHNVD